jgi:hypothetical protein
MGEDIMDNSLIVAGPTEPVIETNLPRFLAGSALTTAVSPVIGLYTGRWDVGVVTFLALVGVVLIVRDQ